MGSLGPFLVRSERFDETESVVGQIPNHTYKWLHSYQLQGRFPIEAKEKCSLILARSYAETWHCDHLDSPPTTDFVVPASLLLPTSVQPHQSHPNSLPFHSRPTANDATLHALNPTPSLQNPSHFHLHLQQESQPEISTESLIGLPVTSYARDDTPATTFTATPSSSTPIQPETSSAPKIPHPSPSSQPNDLPTLIQLDNVPTCRQDLTCDTTSTNVSSLSESEPQIHSQSCEKDSQPQDEVSESASSHSASLSAPPSGSKHASSQSATPFHNRETRPQEEPRPNPSCANKVRPQSGSLRNFLRGLQQSEGKRAAHSKPGSSSQSLRSPHPLKILLHKKTPHPPATSLPNNTVPGTAAFNSPGPPRQSPAEDAQVNPQVTPQPLQKHDTTGGQATAQDALSTGETGLLDRTPASGARLPGPSVKAPSFSRSQSSISGVKPDSGLADIPSSSRVVNPGGRSRPEVSGHRESLWGAGSDDQGSRLHRALERTQPSLPPTSRGAAAGGRLAHVLTSSSSNPTVHSHHGSDQTATRSNDFDPMVVRNIDAEASIRVSTYELLARFRDGSGSLHNLREETRAGSSPPGTTVESPAQHNQGGQRRSPRYMHNLIADMQFDPSGALLAVVRMSGSVCIHSVSSLRAAGLAASAPRVTRRRAEYAWTPPPVFQAPPPLAATEDCLPMQSLSWNPHTRSELACVGPVSREVVVYDLLHGRSGNGLTLTHTINNRFARIEGFNEVQHGQANPALLFAGGTDGVVSMWDRRVSRCEATAVMRPPVTSTMVGGPRSGPIKAFQVSPDDQLVYAGYDKGMICVWDARKGKKEFGSMTNAKEYHEQVANISVPHLLSDIEQLAAEVEIRPSAITCLRLDPLNPHRLAYHLQCGWSGVLDVGSASVDVTHAHCPPTPWESEPLLYETPSRSDESTAPNALFARRGTWMPSHGLFCVGSTSNRAIRLLDFSNNPRAGCWVKEAKHPPEFNPYTCRRQGTLPTKLSVPEIPAKLSQWASVVVSNPVTDELVSAVVSGGLVGVSPRYMGCL